METFEIGAELRTDVGKGASRRLRNAGLVPGILYGAGQDPVNLSVNQNELLRHLEHEAFYSHVLDLKLAGKAEQVVLKDLQRHPARPMVLHVDFQRVSASQKLHMHVPLHFINEDICPGKKAGGLVSHLLTEVEVTCLPRDLPEYIEVDLANMDMDDTLSLTDLKVPAGVELVALSHGEDHDQGVVSIHKTRGGGEEAEAASTGTGEAES